MKYLYFCKKYVHLIHKLNSINLELSLVYILILVSFNQVKSLPTRGAIVAVSYGSWIYNYLCNR